MNWLFKFVLTIVIAIYCLVPWADGHIDVIPFNETTWSRLLSETNKPSAYLFTTSYCSTCPDAFDLLKKTVKNSGKKIDLYVVMMDVDGEMAIKHARYFSGISKLYAFDGFEPSIRQSIDPQWPNVTPYIVLIDKMGGIQRSIGPPSNNNLKKWLNF